VEIEDRLRIETPEGVDLEVTLAGLASRTGACFIDSLIVTATLVVLLIAVTMLGALAEQSSSDLYFLILGIGALASFVLLIGYYLVFESLNGGRTPGKAAFGIRVIRVDGGPLGFGAVVIRNLVRLVDFLPAFYAVGLIAIVTNKRNQRLGDLAAGTVVIRDLKLVAAPAYLADGIDLTVLPPWDVSMVSEEEVGLVRRFAERRKSMQPANRAHLAAVLAGPLRAKIAAPDAPSDDVDFLIRLLAEKLVRER
jgi:uncharacterized RDD family membrane protein YckC